MESTSVRASDMTTGPVSALGNLTAFAVTGLALALAYVQLMVFQGFALPLTVIAVIMVGVAGAILMGWRWMPLIGALLSFILVASDIKRIVDDLTRPQSYHMFAFIVVFVALSTVGTVSGIAAVVQQRRTAEGHMPRMMVLALCMLMGTCIGALLVGALPRGEQADRSAEAWTHLPALSTPGFVFDQAELRARVGERLTFRLDNPHGAPHSFDIDELNVHVPVAAGKSTLVDFTPTTPGRYTYYCLVPGHRELGMEGVLIVDP